MLKTIFLAGFMGAGKERRFWHSDSWSLHFRKWREVFSLCFNGHLDFSDQVRSGKRCRTLRVSNQHRTKDGAQIQAQCHRWVMLSSFAGNWRHILCSSPNFENGNEFFHGFLRSKLFIFNLHLLYFSPHKMLVHETTSVYLHHRYSEHQNTFQCFSALL